MTQYRARAAQIDADQISAENVAELATRFGGSVDPETNGLLVPRYPGGDDMLVPVGFWVWNTEYGILIAEQGEFAAQWDEVPAGPALRELVAANTSAITALSIRLDALNVRPS